MLGSAAELFVFRHAGDANEAFKQLPGAQGSDSIWPCTEGSQAHCWYGLLPACCGTRTALPCDSTYQDQLPI